MGSSGLNWVELEYWEADWIERALGGQGKALLGGEALTRLGYETCQQRKRYWEQASRLQDSYYSVEEITYLREIYSWVALHQVSRQLRRDSICCFPPEFLDYAQ